jgi:hypothetical protein
MHNIPECDNVHEISIIPRGRGAGGYTMFLPDKEVNYISSARLLAQMSGMMGGHCAERLVLGDVSTGSTSDLKRATQIARSMVTEYGMSDKLGPIFLGGEHEVFLGRDFSQSRSTLSEDVNAQVDSEVRRLLESSYERALIILKAHRGILANCGNPDPEGKTGSRGILENCRRTAGRRVRHRGHRARGSPGVLAKKAAKQFAAFSRGLKASTLLSGRVDGGTGLTKAIAFNILAIRSRFFAFACVFYAFESRDFYLRMHGTVHTFVVYL